MWSFLALLLVLFPGFGYPHPQCLDFKPPFEPERPLKFCAQYSRLGCCTQSKDAEIRGEFERIMVKLAAAGGGRCRTQVRDLLCQVCSPYAAHIYDAELTMRATSFPGLCPGYCRDFYARCQHVVKHLSADAQLRRSLRSRSEFCAAVELPDPDYCYPDLLTNPALNSQVSIQRVTSEGCLCVEDFARGLRNPVLARHAGDGSRRLFVAEQRGVVYVYHPNKTVEAEPFLDIRYKVLYSGWPSDERGFLGLTFHPDFSANDKFYVYYSHMKNGGFGEIIRISEMQVSRDDRNRANDSTERVLLEVKQPYSNHNGGEILFGDDHYLYAFIGDGGAGGDPHNYSQNKSALLGKVLRIDVNSRQQNLPYGIPPDNPFVQEQDARPEIYAYGIRNIWRCGKDKGHTVTGEDKGRIICGDVGQNAFEEIDILKKGANYEWNAKEGFQCYNYNLCAKLDGEPPIFAYPHSVGKSVTGGHIYRGCENPNLYGFYIYGDFTNGRLFRLIENKATGAWANREMFLCGPDKCVNRLQGQYEPHILSFGEDEDGEIYLLSTSQVKATSKKGRVYKIVDPARRGNPEICNSFRYSESSPSSVVPERSHETRNATHGAANQLSHGLLEVVSIQICSMIPIMSCITFLIP